MPLFDIAFWALAAVAVASAVGVIESRDLFRAALFLALALLTVAGFFVMLSAEFLAVVQVLIYVGAISILIIFAVMLTREVHRGNPSNRFRVPAGTLAGLLLAAIVVVTLDTPWRLWEKLALGEATRRGAEQVLTDTPAYMGQLFVREFVLPFEVVSVLLLAAILGAIVLVRER